MNHNCLNCNYETNKNYCSNCGQKTSTHRYSLQHFFAHDFIHGIFHFDSGFLFTIKELFTRPGHSVREFIQGKRAKHFNYFTAVILLLTITYFVSKWAKVELTEVFTSSVGLSRVIKDYVKLTTLITVPIYALFSYLIFKKTKQNYTENIVINMFLLVGMLVFRLTLHVVIALTSNIEAINVINLALGIITYAYISIFSYQYFSAFEYPKGVLIRKVLLFSLLILSIKQGINFLINEIGIQYFH
ncbi:MAG: DUF3667 domain-containing protein [Pedobacter sp.]|nr:MAG: DUF3667 domain-containing protein [Pedobacter sp.]